MSSCHILIQIDLILSFLYKYLFMFYLGAVVKSFFKINVLG